MARSPLPARKRAPRVTARLRAIVECVPVGTAVLADIGTDHGFVPLRALRAGRAKRAVACDIRASPLAAARRTAARERGPLPIEFRLGDGLEPLADGEADAVTIAGLGDANVRDILERGRSRLEGVGRLVLNPLGDAHRVRGWLRDHAWDLVDEREVVEGAFHYVVLVAEPGEGERAYRESSADVDVALRVGPMLVSAPSAHLRAHFAARLRAARDVEDQLAGKPELEARRVEWVSERRLLERVVDALS